MSQVPSRYSAKAISGSPIKNDSSTLLNAGNVNSALANNLTLAENAGNQTMYGSQINVSVSPTSSGNVGVGKAISNGTVNVNTEGNYIATLLGTKIAGVTSTQMRNTGGATPRSSVMRWQGYHRLGVNTWDSNHIITKGAGAGVAVLPSGIDGRVGPLADDANLYPGEYTEKRQGIAPVQDEYLG